MSTEGALVIVTPPATGPVTYDLAKLHCHVDHDEEQSLIEGYILAAAERAERWIRRAMIARTLEYSLPAFPTAGGAIVLPYPPLLDVDQVRYIGTDGQEHELDEYDLTVDVRSDPGRVLPASGAWPATTDVPNAVVVRYVAGYGTEPKDVPARYRQAVLMLVGHWYANREQVVTGTITAELPEGVRELLWDGPVFA